MKTAERIDPFIDELRRVWRQNPDLRFGQLVINIKTYGEIRNLYNVEDEYMLKEIVNYGELYGMRNGDLL